MTTNTGGAGPAPALSGPELGFADAGLYRLDLRRRSIDDISDESLLATMRAIRVFEERIRDLRLSLDIVGSVHLGIGQEAIAVGALLALSVGDPVFSTYRGHGWALACGSSFEAMFAELLGRSGGVNGGRGGSAYLSDADEGFYGENSIVGAGAPIASGAALAAKFDGTDQVALTVFGDGAMNQGSVSEALNFAAAMKLPIIFLCENNRYSELTLIADVVNNDQLFERGAPYGIPSVRIDGNDARAVAAAVAAGAARARAGEGPTLIEAMTERLVGHYIGDSEQYRVKGELEQLKEDEPIARLTRTLDPQRVAEIENTVRAAVVQASERALAQPLADAGQVLDHMYSEEITSA